MLEAINPIPHTSILAVAAFAVVTGLLAFLMKIYRGKIVDLLTTFAVSCMAYVIVMNVIDDDDAAVSVAVLGIGALVLGAFLSFLCSAHKPAQVSKGGR